MPLSRTTSSTSARLLGRGALWTGEAATASPYPPQVAPDCDTPVPRNSVVRVALQARQAPHPGSRYSKSFQVTHGLSASGVSPGSVVPCSILREEPDPELSPR